MLAVNRTPSRRGLTLIELLVVIGILAVLATLVVLYVIPAFSDNKNTLRGADRLITGLLIAKQRALRDQGPRGVRFILNSSSQAVQFVYIEQPDPFTGGAVSVTFPAGNVATFTGVDFVGPGDPADTTFSDWVVQPGDYFRWLGNPSNYPIIAPLTATSLTLRDPVPVLFSPITAATQYQIIRQTRPISGEIAIDMPNNVVVDLTQVPATNQIPNGFFPTGAAFYEILFDPGGGVMNRSGSTPIVMVVRDATADNPLDPNTTRVLAINPRTGFIAAHPVGPVGNPLQYALDGKSSGM
jgi:prepilin-type N-terminal cleavage/methylation domain-containing protein